MNMKNYKAFIALLMMLTVFGCARMVSAQTTAFTYQGQLSDGATVANGTFQTLAVNGAPSVAGVAYLNTQTLTTGRGNVSFVLALNANDTVVITVKSSTTVAGTEFSTNGTTRLAIVKLN